MMYSLNEIGLLPSSTPTNINHRGDINISTKEYKLPIFVSPMASIINIDNYKLYQENGVIPIIPRTFDSLEDRLKLCESVWCAFSLSDFDKYFCKGNSFKTKHYVLIDIANGHMQCLYDLVRKAKKIHNHNLVVMVGNIAHPDMYWECYKAGVDYVRVGIGGGSACTTSVLTGIHATIPWILKGINKIKEEINFIPKTKPFPKVIADGGINTIDKIIKCLALGADYVMCGKLFAQCEECHTKESDVIYCNGSSIMHRYYGMASIDGQIAISGKSVKSPEGISLFVDVTTSLSDFLKSTEAALKSAMSYTGAHNLEEFKTTKYEIFSLAEREAYYK